MPHESEKGWAPGACVSSCGLRLRTTCTRSLNFFLIRSPFVTPLVRSPMCHLLNANTRSRLKYQCSGSLRVLESSPNRATESLSNSLFVRSIDTSTTKWRLEYKLAVSSGSFPLLFLERTGCLLTELFLSCHIGISLPHLARISRCGFGAFAPLGALMPTAKDVKRRGKEFSRGQETLCE